MYGFKPQQPDPFIRRPEDMTIARFGHLNALVRQLNGLAATATATADGSATASVKDNNNQFVSVISEDADHIVRLPALTEEVIGSIVRLSVGDNGFKLRAAAEDQETVTLNGTANSEIVIPADSYVEAKAVSLTAWLVNVYDSTNSAVAVTPEVIV